MEFMRVDILVFLASNDIKEEIWTDNWILPYVLGNYLLYSSILSRSDRIVHYNVFIFRYGFVIMYLYDTKTC